MKKNVEGTIDDLLVAIDQELLAGYAQKHGRRPEWANAAYKSICREGDALYRKYLIIFWSWVAVVLFVATYAATAVFWLLGFTVLMLTWLALVLKEIRDNADTVAKYRRVLAEFRAAVEALNLKAPPYTEHAVRAMLADAALELIMAERLLEIHRHGRYSAEDLFKSCRNEADCTRNLEEKIRAAEKFGLVADKSNLRFFAEKMISAKK